jgi:hypothetical protein
MLLIYHYLLAYYILYLFIFYILINRKHISASKIASSIIRSAMVIFLLPLCLVSNIDVEKTKIMISNFLLLEIITLIHSRELNVPLYIHHFLTLVIFFWGNLSFEVLFQCMLMEISIPFTFLVYIFSTYFPTYKKLNFIAIFCQLITFILRFLFIVTAAQLAYSNIISFNIIIIFFILNCLWTYKIIKKIIKYYCNL